MTELANFLLARIAEDEALARDSFYGGQAWATEEEAVVSLDRDLEPILFMDHKRDAAHAANWSPSRVLAECAAKRAIVNLHASDITMNGEYVDGYYEALELAVRALASAYVGHPSYQQEWAVQPG